MLYCKPFWANAKTENKNFPSHKLHYCAWGLNSFTSCRLTSSVRTSTAKSNVLGSWKVQLSMVIIQVHAEDPRSSHSGFLEPTQGDIFADDPPKKLAPTTIYRCIHLCLSYTAIISLQWIKKHQHIYERRENEIGNNTPTCRELYTKPRRGWPGMLLCGISRKHPTRTWA